MGDRTRIEWTDATWNPVTGCTPFSEGCKNCYAKQTATSPRYKAAFPNGFAVTLHEDRLDMPAHWRKPRMVFVNSMSDLFHCDVPGRFINTVWMAMYNNRHHTYQVLTKRLDRLLSWTLDKAKASGWPADEVWPAWIWLGATIERGRYLDRLEKLRQVPAKVRFISVEPMIGRVDLPDDAHEYLHWVICGAETGNRGARQMELAWARMLRDQCIDQKIPFFFKRDSLGNRTLDGTMWEQFPEVVDVKIGEQVKL